LTTKDLQRVELQSQILDKILKKYATNAKAYKTLFIASFRKSINSGKLSASQKAFYNQLLIHLFTIDSL
jgi:hypothetical protein